MTLRAHAASVLSRAHVPYSRAPVGVALGLASGRWVAAPRIESASYPLTIPALQGAWALAAPHRDPIVVAASTRAFTEAEVAFLEATTETAWTRSAPDLAACGASSGWGASAVEAYHGPKLWTREAEVALALEAAQRAVVPASGFQVGAVAIDVEGRVATGCNVEHPADWTRGLCAERSALVAARALGFGRIARVALACPEAPGAAPCGGCRQLLAEQAPNTEIVIGTGDALPRIVTPGDLLPHAFTGQELDGRLAQHSRGDEPDG